MSNLSHFLLQIFEDVAVKTIILECCSNGADENQILECVSTKLEESSVDNLTDCIQNDLISCINYTAIEYNVLFEGDPVKMMEYLQIFGKYLDTITQVLSKCQKIALNFRKLFETNSKFIETVLDFLKNLSNVDTFLNTTMRTKWCTIKTELTYKLFSFTFDLYKTSFVVDVMKKSQENDERVKTLYDRCGTLKLIEMLISKPVS